MQIMTVKQGFYFSGTVRELRTFLKNQHDSALTFQQWLARHLH